MRSDPLIQPSTSGSCRFRKLFQAVHLGCLITAITSITWVIRAQVDQTLNWEAPAADTVLILQQAYELEASSSSGLPVTFKVDSGPATIVSGKVTATGMGPVVLTAEQAGGPEFLPALERRTFNQTSVGASLLSEWPNYPRGGVSDVFVQGNLAYVAMSMGGLLILDVSDPTKPLRLGGCKLNSSAIGIVVADGYAYLSMAYPNRGLQVIDIGDPKNPVPVSEYRTSMSARGLWKEGPLLFVANNIYGVEILDASNPRSIVHRGNMITVGAASGVQVAGELAYVASSAGLDIFDVSRPESPVLVGNCPNAATVVLVVGHLAYLSGFAGGLDVIDVTDPRQPIRIGHSNWMGNTTGLGTIGNLAYVSSDAGLSLFDITSPSQPSPFSVYHPGEAEVSIHIAGDRVYVASAEAGLQIFSTDAFANLTLLGKYMAPSLTQSVQVVGDLAYVADGEDGVLILDVGDPSDPRLLGAFDTAGNASMIDVHANLAYVADGSEGLLVMDVSNPATPIQLGKNATHMARRVRVSGNLAYVADPSKDLAVLDISNPAFPSLAGEIDDVREPYDVQIVDDVAYLVGNSGKFYTVSAGDPAQLKTLGEWNYLINPLRAVTLVGGNAYVVSFDGLYITDASDPHTSLGLGRFNTFSQATGVDVKDGFAYLTTVEGLQIVDVSNPRSPVRRGEFASRGWSQGVQVEGNVAYLADGYGGLKILQLRRGVTQGISFSPPDFLLVKDPPAITEVPLTATTQSGQPVTFTLVSGPATLSGNILTITNGGSITVRAEAAASDQFLTETREQTIWAQKAVQTIDFKLPTLLLLDVGETNLSATASSALPVTFSVLTGPAVIDGARLVLTNSGAVVVRAEQPGNAEFLPAYADQTVIVDSPVVILRQPAATNVVLGAAATLSVAVNGGEPLSYAWYQNGRRINGNTSAQLAYAAVTQTNAGLYHVVVANLYNNVTSSVVSLTVDAPGSELVLRPRGSVALRNPPQRQGPASIDVQGNHAFVTDLALTSVNVYDFSNPDSLQLVSSIPFRGTSHEDSALFGGYLFLAERENGLGLVDVHDPSKPIRLSSVTIPGNKRDAVTIRVRDSLAYVGDGNYGLAIFDISTPTNAVLLGSLDTAGIAAGTFLSDNTLYVADWNEGLKIMDVSNPKLPTLLAKYPAKADSVSKTYYDLVVHDRVALVADTNAGLVTLNLTNLSDIRKVTTVPGSIWSLDVANRFLFAADNAPPNETHTGGLRVLDLINPTMPAAMGRFVDWGTMDGVLVKENRLFVAGTRFGIIDLVFGGAPPALGIQPEAQGIRLAWPHSPDGFVLESAVNLSGDSAWGPVTQEVKVTGGTNSVLAPKEGQTRFYRLRQN